MQNDNSDHSIGYADMAARLHALAAAAIDPAVSVQLIDLATRYELLAEKAVEMSDKYLPVVPDASAAL